MLIECTILEKWFVEKLNIEQQQLQYLVVISTVKKMLYSKKWSEKF